MNKKITDSIYNNPRCGINIRNTNDYIELSNKYNVILKESEYKYIPENSTKVNNLIMQIEEILINKSKDIEILVWLLCLETILNGYNGLIKTIDILLDLIPKYFQEFHPLVIPFMEEESEIVEYKINQINYIDNKISIIMNDHIFVDKYKQLNLSNLFELTSDYNDNKIEDLFDKELVISNLINIQNKLYELNSILMQYEHYNGNENIKITTFPKINKNIANIIIKLESLFDNKYDILKEKKETNKSNTEVDKFINGILDICKHMKNYNEYKVKAHIIEYIIKIIPNDNLELARLIRKNDLIAGIIDAIIEDSEQNEENNEF